MGINRPFFSDLRTASWRGVPFGVHGSEGGAGRKNAVHSYPFKDFDWVEDLGRKSRTLRVRGFLIEGGGSYGGSGSVIAQRARLMAACEESGDGVLVHPTLGTNLRFSLLDFNWSEDKESGRVIEVEFELKESKKQAVVVNTVNTPGTTLLAALKANIAIVQDYLAQAHAFGVGVVQAVLTPVNMFSTLVRSVTFTATSLVNMVAALPGEIGRFVGATFPANLKVQGATVQTLIGSASAAQESVLSSVTALQAAAVENSQTSVASGIQAATAALLAANPDPGQAIRSMQAVLSSTAATPQPSAAATAANVAVTDLMRRSAVIAMATASAQYQPTSYQDAQAMRATVCHALDHEMNIAGDEGLDETYAALRDLKIAVSQDLTARGANLSTVITVTSPLPVSSLVWAQKLYQDASREEQLVQSGNPIHPAFMPVSFQALAK